MLFDYITVTVTEKKLPNNKLFSPCRQYNISDRTNVQRFRIFNLDFQLKKLMFYFPQTADKYHNSYNFIISPGACQLFFKMNDFTCTLCNAFAAFCGSPATRGIPTSLILSFRAPFQKNTVVFRTNVE